MNEDVWTLFKMGIFQPAMFVYRRVVVTRIRIFSHTGCVFFKKLEVGDL